MLRIFAKILRIAHKQNAEIIFQAFQSIQIFLKDVILNSSLREKNSVKV